MVHGAPATRALWVVGLAMVVFALAYRLEAPPLFEDPNDGQYAEVAREMLESGDWISPQLNYVLFLNKPPLLYWLIAVSYKLFGVNEAAARLPGVLVMLVTLLLLYHLGRSLFGSNIGALGACVYAAMPATVIEARFVRPDGLLVASTVAALLAFHVALHSQGSRRRRALYGFQLALAAGLLAKGIVALLLPGFAVAVVILAEKRWDFLLRLAAPRSWLLFFILITPWHVVAAVRHPGFAWDYIVNQHFLFFLDRKFPRDSIPVPLSVFWGAFLGRLFPWTIFLPLVVLHSVRQWGTARGQVRPHTLPLAWAVGVLLFFSLATSRLEHYALPAIPAVALLTGAALEHLAGAGHRGRRTIQAHLGCLLALAVAGLWWAPGLLAEDTWLRQATTLPNIARGFTAALCVGCVAAILAAHRAPRVVAPVLGFLFLALMPLIHRGLVALTPINSSAPVAQLLERNGADTAAVVFEAPVEYQHVAGLNFYLRRKVHLLRPPGFVEPTYLLPHRDALFLPRDELLDMWRREPVLLVSDPLASTDRPPTAVAPGPYTVLGHIGNRWILSNRIDEPAAHGAGS